MRIKVCDKGGDFVDSTNSVRFLIFLLRDAELTAIQADHKCKLDRETKLDPRVRSIA